jgi:hypothetical protein|nr:MAG TPA: hypothetical protein [Caudoviricetes sp.]
MATYAYFCFRRLGILPGQFDDLDINEKAAVIAFVQKWMRESRKREKELRNAEK